MTPLRESQDTFPLLTVVVVAWRSASTIDACLASALPTGHESPPEVVVVLNDVDQQTRARVEAWTPRVRTVDLPRNTGFAGGVHAATARVRTPWLLLLNDDAVLEPGALDALERAAREAPDTVAAIQAAVRIEAPGPARTNSTGNQVTPDGYGYDRDWLQPWPPTRPSEDEPFGFCGAAAVLRTAAVRQVGGMDPSLFLYYEDTDLSWRLRLAGWRTRYCPDAVVAHRHGSSSVEGSPLFRFYNERNRLLVLARDATTVLAALQWARYPLTVLSLTLARGPRKAQTTVRVRAWLSAWRGLPRALRARRTDVVRVPRAQVQRLLEAPPSPIGGLRA